MSQWHIRKGKPEDCEVAFALIEELAGFEKAASEVVTTASELQRDVFEEKVCDFFVAEKNGKVVGLALYYVAYSTWKGKSLYLEDLIVEKSHRGQGIGKALIAQVIALGKDRGYRRIAWQVLDWNQPAIDFYRSLGAELEDEWINCRLH